MYLIRLVHVQTNAEKEANHFRVIYRNSSMQRSQTILWADKGMSYAQRISGHNPYQNIWKIS